ncbi:formyltransferase family protein [Rheinheimera sp. MMS21-TC3]|uniref:formyltransferase family protein n=1 Tax=Rheinheimera sp. MMS21-TC3 TaxID=3072790 RepID=UPI0028C39B79|nr:formyltransferase family protein [Rheinheimera sp. MMS21-TC3]WNO61816.1 hypothetical protein RDV63_12885 [Rheinheimera sp. MMS21-TC3]
MTDVRVALFVVGEKGLHVLRASLAYYRRIISYVVIGRDLGVSNDFFEEIKSVCVEYDLPFYSRGAEPCLASDDDYFYRICIGWRWLISCNKNLIVLHDSKLPAYRGFNPLVTALLNKDKEISVSAIFADNDADSGDVIICKSRFVDYPIKVCDAIKLSIEIYVEIVVFLLEKMLSGENILGIAQSSEYASYSVWRDDYDYFIDWSESSEFISRFCDSVGYPYAGAKSFMNGKLVRVVECVVFEDVNIVRREKNIGKILFFSDKKPVVICGSGLVKLIKIENFSDLSEIRDLSIRTRFFSNNGRYYHV